MKDNINRISIVGGSGTGKTTLSESMGKELNIPVYHIDGMNYSENWQERSKEERDKMILEKVNTEKWIIDGTYLTTLKQRFEKSDLIIYLDYSSLAQVRGALGRFFKEHGKERVGIPGCKEKMSLSFLLWVFHWRKNKRDDILRAINNVDQGKVFVFKNRRQLNKWYKEEFGRKIVTK